MNTAGKSLLAEGCERWCDVPVSKVKGVAKMSEDNRRRHSRLKLQWGVVCSEGAESVDEAGTTQGQSWTRDISAGGMYFVMPSVGAPGKGSMLAFKLAVPPGEGYSASGCTVLASGEVLRQVRQEDGTVGLAVRFAQKPEIRPF